MALLLGFAPPGPDASGDQNGADRPCGTWVPLLVLSFASGVALGDAVEVPFLRDPTVYTRYLVALAAPAARGGCGGTALASRRERLSSRVSPRADLPKYQYFKAEFVRLHDSWVVQGVIVILSYVLVITMRTTLAYRPGSSSWERLGADSGGVITPPGWWCVLVCLPVLVFLLAMVLEGLHLGLVPLPRVTARAGSDAHPPGPCRRPRIPRLGSGQLQRRRRRRLSRVGRQLRRQGPL